MSLLWSLLRAVITRPVPAVQPLQYDAARMAAWAHMVETGVRVS